MKRRNSKATPLLVGHPVAAGMIAVWCPFCKSHHLHGWDEESAADDVSHRVAHCGPVFNSPFMEKGYFIGLEVPVD